MNKKIAILTHAKQKFAPVPYLLNPLIDRWRDWGIEVVVLRGIERREPADALFMHIDLTRAPRDYQAFARSYPLVVNGRVGDISKRRISAQLVDRRAPYDGPVLVKTDRNFGGGQERRLARRKRLRRLADKLGQRLPWSWRSYLNQDDYPVYDSPAAVPWPVWWNRHLVVEKFLPERDGDCYCLRQWVFLGDREISQRLVAAEPIVKAGKVLRRESGIPIPEELRARRAALGFDYGKFDFVLVDGEAVLLDVNWTPSFTIGTPTPAQAAILETLAQGLPPLLDRPGSG